MWSIGEKCCGDRDDCLWSLFILVAMVNASVDEGGENRHTGGVGSLPGRHSIGGYWTATGLGVDSLVHEMEKSLIV